MQSLAQVRKVEGKIARRPAVESEHEEAAKRTHPAALIQQAHLDPSSLSAAAVLQLQRTIGNQAVQGLLGRQTDTAVPTTSPNVRVMQVLPTAEGLPALAPRQSGGDLAHKMTLRRKIGLEKTAPGPDALGGDATAELGDDYGLTWPQQLRVVLSAKIMGDHWVPAVKDLTGEYSVQARILGHQTDITGPGTADTAVHAQEQIAALDTLGVPGDTHNWYSLKAVQAHESRHATRCLQALMDKRDEINALVEAVTIPKAGVATEGAAIGQIQALPAYTQALVDGFSLWNDRFDELINGDHTGDGPCEVAEKSITVPLKEAIVAKQKQQRWLAPPPMVPLF